MCFFVISHLKSQYRCEIGVNPNDCYSCKPIYKYINDIDQSLNPKIYMADVDERTANFFINDYLKIKNVSNEINETKYNELYKNLRPLVKVYNKDSLIMEFETRDLPYFIDSINSLKSKVYIVKNELDMVKNIEVLNDSAKNLFGFYRFRNYDNVLSIYSEISKKLLVHDFNSGICNVFDMNDSFIYNQLITKIKFSDKFEKYRKFYRNEMSEILPDGQIVDWLKINGKVYLSFVINKYDNMLNQEQLKENNFEVFLSYNYYIGEFSILNNKLVLENVKLISEKGFDPLKLNLYISIYNNKPILLFYDKVDLMSLKAYLLDSNYKVINYPRINNMYLHKQLIANTYQNQFTTFKYNNILTNNLKGKFVKLSPYTNDSIENIDFVEINNDVFVLMNSYKNKMGYLYKVNFDKQSLQTLKIYQNYDKRTFDGCLVYDKFKGCLYVINMHKDKFRVLDTVELKTPIKK